MKKTILLGTAVANLYLLGSFHSCKPVAASKRISNDCKPAKSTSSNQTGSNTNTGTNSDTTEESETDESTESTDLRLANTVSFTTDVQPILQSKCLSCHSGSKSPKLNSYSLFKTNYTKSMSEINSGGMPPSSTKVTAAEKTILQNWATGGYLQNGTVSPSPSPTGSPSPSSSPSVSVSYDSDIKTMLQSANCFGCHTSKAPVLTDYASVKTAASDIYTSINSGTMPKGGSKMSTTTIAKFKLWMDSGMPESSSNNGSVTPSDSNTNGSDDATPSDSGC
ncbi:MAG: hypothetical protein NT027_19925 [Proteobacteria bacterium]|nr:hypothetical protein [Pseudomonadota bacterium]